MMVGMNPDREHDILDPAGVSVPDELPLMKDGVQIGVAWTDVREDGIYSIATLFNGDKVFSMRPIPRHAKPLIMELDA